MMKASQTYDDKFFVMADKDNELVTIDWIDGGKIHKAQFPAMITAWSFNDNTREIVLTNMRQIIQMNLGAGLRIMEMYCRFSFEELPNVVTEQNLIDSTRN